MKKLLLITAILTLSGCSTQQMMCAGTGTCYGDARDGAYSTDYNGQRAGGSFSARTVQTPLGNYAVIPNYSTGRVTAIVGTSKGR